MSHIELFKGRQGVDRCQRLSVMNMEMHTAFLSASHGRHILIFHLTMLHARELITLLFTVCQSNCCENGPQWFNLRLCWLVYTIQLVLTLRRFGNMYSRYNYNIILCFYMYNSPN